MCASIIEKKRLEHDFVYPLVKIDGCMAQKRVLKEVFVSCWSRFFWFFRVDEQKFGLDDHFAAILVNMRASIIENGGLEHHFVLPLVKIDALMAKTNVLIPVFV